MSKSSKSRINRELACIEMGAQRKNSDEIVQFTGLLDSGANASLISENLIRDLGYLNEIKTMQAVHLHAFDGNSTPVNKFIELPFSIGPLQFNHRFFVQSPSLCTNTEALLGIEFLNKYNFVMEFSPKGPTLSLNQQKIPIVEKHKRRLDNGSNLKTYAICEKAESEDCPLLYAKAAEYKKVNPLTATVCRVILPQGINWPEHAVLERTDHTMGYVVEEQLVTIRTSVPSKRAKCKPECSGSKHEYNCGTIFQNYALILVFNTSNNTIYLTPGENVAKVEPQYANQELTDAVNKQINILNQKYVEAATAINKKLEKTRAKNKRRRESKKLTKTTQLDTNTPDENCFSEPTDVVEQNSPNQPTNQVNVSASKELFNKNRRENYHFGQNIEQNFLELDPHKNKEEYNREYLKKHKPPIPLQIRKQKVKELIERSYPDIDPQAKALLLKYPESVHLENIPFVGVKTISHRITYQGPIFWNRQYRTPVVLEEDIKAELSRLIAEDIIEPAESEYNNALLPVAKRDPVTGKLKLRLVVDFRSLNSGIEVDRILVADVQDLISKLDGVRYVTVIDAASGYLQIGILPESQKYTAFRYANRCYAYKRMAFGLGSAPSSYVRCMTVILSGLSNCFCYMDDIIIFSKTLDEHLKTLELVLKRFSYHGMELSLKKSSFLKSQVDYLGFTVTTEGLKMSQKLVNEMLKIELPKTLTEARKLCSLFSFYRRFIKNYAAIAEPLVNLTRGHGVAKGDRTPVEPDEKCREALKRLKDILIKNVSLKYPNFSKPFIITSDGSTHGLGAHLSQEDSKGQQRPVAFASRALHGSEKRYPPVELECLAIIYALKQFRHIILGYDIYINTDHKPLIYLMRHVDPTSRLYRYQLCLLEYNIKNLAYIEGPSNTVADYLSRFSLGADEELSPTVVCQLDSEMAGAVPPNYHYKKGQKLKNNKNCLVVFCENARNLFMPELTPEQAPIKSIIEKLYKARKPIVSDMNVAQRDSCPSVGEVIFNIAEDGQYATIITNLQTPPKGNSEQNKLRRQTINNPELLLEGFKFKRSSDNNHIRDYYFMEGLAKIIKHCDQTNNIKEVQLLWPSILGELDTGKRLRNIISHITHFGYALWQRNIELFVIGQPDLCVENSNFLCATLAAQPESKLIREKLDLDLIVKEQAKDSNIQKLITELNEKGMHKEEYWVSENILFKIANKASKEDTARVYIPVSLRKLVIELFHDRAAHPGIAKTYMQCQSQVFWPNMNEDIQKYIAKCMICVQAKCSVNKRVMCGHLHLPPRANHTLAIDILGSLPKSNSYDQCLIVVCTYSRFVRVAPLKNGTALAVQNVLTTIFQWQGKCSMIISDNAGCFLSHQFKDFLEERQINHHKITAYNPMSNLSERSIRNVLSVLRVLTKDKPSKWDTYLPQVADALNMGFNLSLKETPYYLFFGRNPEQNDNFLNSEPPPTDPSDLYYKTKYSFELVEKTLTDEHEKEDLKLQSSGRLTHYNVGDIVYVARNFVNDKSYKLKYPYCGPYRVESIVGNTVLLLNLSNGKTRQCSMRNIKIYKSDDLTKTDHPNVDKIYPLQSNNPDESMILEGSPPKDTELKKKSEAVEITRKYELRSRKQNHIHANFSDNAKVFTLNTNFNEI